MIFPKDKKIRINLERRVQADGEGEAEPCPDLYVLLCNHDEIITCNNGQWIID